MREGEERAKEKRVRVTKKTVCEREKRERGER